MSPKPGPSRAGVLIYAKNLQPMSTFYQRLLGMRVLLSDGEHHILESADCQLILHAIPPHIAEGIVIAVPPELREEQAIKPYFTVPSLSGAEALAAELGGRLFGSVWDGPGFSIRNACDVEGNIIQLRAFDAPASS
jgi:predicted enzyme related to lactoylglutathione lyase